MKVDVVVPVYADTALTHACLRSVLDHGGDDVAQLIVVDDRGPDPAMPAMLEALRAEDGRVVVVTNEENRGFVSSANRGLSLRERDVLLLNSDAELTPGALAELTGVLGENDRIAAVTPLSNNATLCSVPDWCEGVAPGALDGVKLSPGLPRYTQLPTGVGFCMLMRHSVLNMIGLFDPVYGRGYNEENDWCARAQQLGFLIARANRALVLHHGQVSFGADRDGLEKRNAALLSQRYPHYLRQNQVFEHGPEARVAAHQVKRQLQRPRVCLDVSHLGGAGTLNGSGVYAFELLKGLAASGRVELSVRAATEAQRALVAPLGVAESSGDEQVFHRPAQIFKSADLEVFLQAKCPAVITFQDLIAFRSPSALASFDEVARYRSFSYAAVQSAQAVVAISDHNRRELIETFGLPESRVHTVHLGIDAEAFARKVEAPPRRPYLLHAGSDYPHKNLRLLLAGYALLRAQLRDAPDLVLVGPASHARGSLYDRVEAWPPGVQYLGERSSDEVRALYQGASAFVFPSAYEGFGLPALEAMACGVPLVASSLTSIPEVAGDAAVYLRDFSPEELAAAVKRVLTSPALRSELSTRGRARARQFTWAETAKKTLDVYFDVLDRPEQKTLFGRQMFAQLFGLYADSERRWRRLVE